MLRSSSPSRRNAGRLLIVTAVAVALPLTASHAIAYVDVPAPAAPPARTVSFVPATAPVAPPARGISFVPAIAPVAATAVPAVNFVPAAAPVAAAAAPGAPAPVGAVAPVAPGTTYADPDDNMTINQDFITIDGKRKRWEELTPAEFARVKAAVAKARTELANTHIDQAKLMRDLANVPDQARIAELQRQLVTAQANMTDSIRRMDAAAAQARAAGRQASPIDAAVRATLQASLQSANFAEASRALASIDPKKIRDQVAGAQQSIDKAKVELDRIQARIDADPRH